MTRDILILVARVLLAFMFVMSGFSKLMDASGTAGMIGAANLPAPMVLAYLAGAFELLAGLAVLVGFQVRIAGFALAAFCIFTAFVFHGASDMVNQIMFMKNITLAGAYILLAAVGAGALSVDARRGVAVTA